MGGSQLVISGYQVLGHRPTLYRSGNTDIVQQRSPRHREREADRRTGYRLPTDGRRIYQMNSRAFPPRASRTRNAGSCKVVLVDRHLKGSRRLGKQGHLST